MAGAVCMATIHYRTAPEASGHERQKLNRELTVLSNDIRSESHGRVSFALSCLILVIVGCCLGMMFKSGNFLTAFAVSFVPAGRRKGRANR